MARGWMTCPSNEKWVPDADIAPLKSALRSDAWHYCTSAPRGDFAILKNCRFSLYLFFLFFLFSPCYSLQLLVCLSNKYPDCAHPSSLTCINKKACFSKPFSAGLCCTAHLSSTEPCIHRPAFPSAMSLQEQQQQQQPPPSETSPLLNPSVSSPTPQNEDHDDEEIYVIPTVPLSTARLYITLGATWVGVFLGAVDASIIVTLSGPISSEFKSLSLLSWLAASYLIANATFQPLSGRLTDVFGRGPGLVFSNLMFGLGNLICGLAKDEKTMIFGRVVAGIGGGGLMSISTFLGSDLVPLKKRGVVQGIGNICYG